MAIGNIIAAARKRAGITQAELGEACDVTSSAVSQWERGDTVPELEKIPTIAQKLRVSAGLLFGDHPDSLEEVSLIWPRLRPQQQKQAIRVLKALADESPEDD